MTRQEAILEARRKTEAGDFNRAIVSIAPESLEWNEATLECGHTAAMLANLKLAALALSDGKEACTACAKQWIEEASKEA